MDDTPADQPASGHALLPADAAAAREEERQRRADAVLSAASEARRLSSQTSGYLPASVPAGGAPRLGLPDTAYDRDGLYGYGQAPSRPGIQAPEVPDGEIDSFDLPRLPYMLVRRPPEPEAGG
jgi:hypothetical protein